MQAIEIERRHEFHDAIIKSCKYTRCDLDYPRMGWTMIDQNAACFLYQRDLNRSLNDHKYKRYWSYRRIAQEFSVDEKSVREAYRNHVKRNNGINLLTTI